MRTVAALLFRIAVPLLPVFDQTAFQIRALPNLQIRHIFYNPIQTQSATPVRLSYCTHGCILAIPYNNRYATTGDVIPTFRE